MAGRGSVLPSVMTKDFSRIPGAQLPQRSVFNRTHGYKTTFDAGYLIPFLVQEILPGDSISLMTHIFARLSTMIFPIMDNIHLDTFYFFVPNRLVWSNWERFCGAQDDPADTIDYEVPVITCPPPNGSTGWQIGTIFDYMGLPTGVEVVTADLPSALPFRMYNLIWNTWFRDQNLQNSVTVNLDDGPDSGIDSTYQLLRRGKRHDYFTSCLPEPQRGDGVALPLGVSAPITGILPVAGTATGATALTDNTTVYAVGGLTGNQQLYIDPIAAAQTKGTTLVPANATATTMFGFHTDPAFTGLQGSMAYTGATLAADLSAATAATINELRLAFATQQFLEADARGGTRYVESLKAHFGVISPDFRLQRPEYLGGGSQPVNVNAVAQTTPNAAPTGLNALGVLGAYSEARARSGFTKSFVEHGYVIGLVNVRADITYQQGMDRHWSRKTRFDFYWPEFAHLGEQAVLTKELYYENGGASANDVFGYQERWAEYRYERSKVTSLFRTAASGSLDVWHLALNFTGVPSLDSTFIVDDPPIDRVIAVSSEPHVLFDSFIQMRHARVMPVYSVPGLQRL